MKPQKIPTLAGTLTPFPFQVDCETSISEARDIMNKHDIRHLIVMENRDIAGIITDRDLHHHAALYGGKPDDSLTVKDIYNTNIVVADIHDPLDKVLESMAERHIGSVVVLNKGELAGIFTTTDACKHFAKFIQENETKQPPDMLA
ncbi:MAG: CBS domain-containing protein [Gammaproteobacteria bacterium]|nr:CBS domain-containing protein [Gammaproteobacteria bacterium]NND39427.1 CBS domain-containing protein [Pseudomonadales bacterium]NNM12680.1 CBS domain-containing protein [Pseudomonadales bacterium]RZV49677.1 MAG: CBS domain-containing protein [Pseudomonadales bacterium]